jgi:uncharacterized protein YjbI with pentapeptide repeats
LTGDPTPAWDALRRQHEELVARLAAPEPDLPDAIRAYVADLATAGEALGDYENRLLAQTMLNYWTAEWIHLTGGQDRYDPPVLADFVGDPKGSSPDSDPSDVKMIRLAAASRLWKESGQKVGYLLTGNTIEDAAAFSGKDADIGDLVRASRKQRRQKRVFAATIAGITAAFILFVPGMLKSYGVQIILSHTERPEDPSATAADPANRGSAEGCDTTRSLLLKFVSIVQRVTVLGNSEIDFSNAGLPHLCADGVTLRMLSFATAKIPGSSFRKADLRSGVFTDATVRDGHFENANLRFAQFKGARAMNARFDGATLFRASFDGAKLEGSSFHGADLRKVSFSGARFGEEFPGSFSGTAWWLAQGWTPEQQARLARLDSATLRDSPGFKAVIAEDLGEIRRTAPGTADRAGNLNALAWSLARFGEDLATGTGSNPGQDCPPEAAIPATALEAATAAVCLARSLKLAPTSLGNFLDTEGYVLLQLERPRAAVTALQEAFDATNAADTQFRLGIALAASGRVEDGVRQVRAALQDKRYQPTHELQRLKAYITGDLAAIIDQTSETASCPR